MYYDSLAIGVRHEPGYVILTAFPGRWMPAGQEAFMQFRRIIRLAGRLVMTPPGSRELTHA
jgi:hypothetical protein